MGRYALCAAVAVVAAVMVGLSSVCRNGERLIRPDDPHACTGRRIGLLAVIVEANAYLRSGGPPQRAFEEGHNDSGVLSPLDEHRLRTVLAHQAYVHETPAQIAHVAAELAVAIRCSERLGSELVRSLEAVADSYRSWVSLEELKDNAFAMPQATVKLLSALPIGTVVLGEMMNARPIAFLVGTTQGLVCLLLGGFAYALGMVWMRSLLHGMTLETLPNTSGA